MTQQRRKQSKLLEQVKLLEATVNKTGFSRDELSKRYHAVLVEMLNLYEVASVRLFRRKRKTEQIHIERG